MKTIFITGASSGLGKAAAKLFQQNGWQVIATMRNPEAETELAALDRVILLPLDVTHTAQMQQTIKNCLETYPVDVVLNNAGYGLIGPLEALGDAQIEKQIQTNLTGLIGVTKAFVPHFRQKQSGLFINITSTFGLLGFPTCSLYCSTKFAVDGFSESLAYELAQFNVNVKIVAPGGMQTDFVTRSMEAGQHEAYTALAAEVAKGYSAEQVANYSRVEDVAQVIFDAATDGKNQLRYVAGNDANALYNSRIEGGAEAQYRDFKAMFNFDPQP